MKHLKCLIYWCASIRVLWKTVFKIYQSACQNTTSTLGIKEVLNIICKIYTLKAHPVLLACCFCDMLQMLVEYVLLCVVCCSGAEGKVDESLAVLTEVETLKTKKKEAEVTPCPIIY